MPTDRGKDRGDMGSTSGQDSESHDREAITDIDGITEHGNGANEVNKRASRRFKRRRVVQESDEDCDDDEPSHIPQEPNREAQLQEQQSVDREQVRTPEEPKGGSSTQGQPFPKRLVLLSVRINNSTYTRFAAPENIIRQVPDYSHKLDKAIGITPDGERLRITDKKIRREEAVIQAIEYLSAGILEPLNLESCDISWEVLKELIYLYDLAILLEIDVLQHAIVNHIAKGPALSPYILVDFAAECYRKGKESHEVAPDCLLGQFLKTKLADSLPALVESGAVLEVNNIGGTLCKQLVEVYTENFQAIQDMKAKADYGKVKIEID